MQEHEINGEKVKVFVDRNSKTLTESQQKWTIQHKELHAIAWALDKNYYRLYGRKYTVMVDNNNIVQWMNNGQNDWCQYKKRMAMKALDMAAQFSWISTDTNFADEPSRNPIPTNERKGTPTDVHLQIHNPTRLLGLTTLQPQNENSE